MSILLSDEDILYVKMQMNLVNCGAILVDGNYLLEKKECFILLPGCLNDLKEKKSKIVIYHRDFGEREMTIREVWGFNNDTTSLFWYILEKFNIKKEDLEV